MITIPFHAQQQQRFRLRPPPLSRKGLLLGVVLNNGPELLLPVYGIQTKSSGEDIKVIYRARYTVAQATLFDIRSVYLRDADGLEWPRAAVNGLLAISGGSDLIVTYQLTSAILLRAHA